MNAFSEDDYWTELEMRVTREFSSDEECRRLGLWCDGFLPNRYDLGGSTPTIEGDVWICSGTEQQSWAFCLVVPVSVLRDGQVEWHRLRLPDDTTDRIELDMPGRRLKISPYPKEVGTSQQADAADGASRPR